MIDVAVDCSENDIVDAFENFVPRVGSSRSGVLLDLIAGMEKIIRNEEDSFLVMFLIVFAGMTNSVGLFDNISFLWNIYRYPNKLKSTSLGKIMFAFTQTSTHSDCEASKNCLWFLDQFKNRECTIQLKSSLLETCLGEIVNGNLPSGMQIDEDLMHVLDLVKYAGKMKNIDQQLIEESPTETTSSDLVEEEDSTEVAIDQDPEIVEVSGKILEESENEKKKKKLEYFHLQFWGLWL